MSRRRSKVSNQKGFTLIEIIAVLVILGILAAVAIPRFMDLTSVASEKAAMQGVSEGKSRMSNQFARNLLMGIRLKTHSESCRYGKCFSLGCRGL